MQARADPAAERLWRWCRRNPAIASAIGVIATSLLVVAIVSSWAAISANASKRNALTQLWHAKLSEARATVSSHQRGQRFTSLQRIREATAIAMRLGMTEQDRLELRNAAIAALLLPDFEVAKEWDGQPANTISVDFDGALERYARADRDGNVSIRRVSDDRELWRMPSLGRRATLRFSPSGRTLLVCGGDPDPGVPFHSGPLKLWHLDAGQPRCVYEGTGLAAPFTDFSADGAQLACESPTRLTIVDVATGREKASWRLPGTVEGGGNGGVKWSPTADRLAIGRWVNGKTVIEVRQAATGKVVASLWHDEESFGFAWRPDGRMLAVGAGTRIHLWDVGARATVYA